MKMTRHVDDWTFEKWEFTGRMVEENALYDKDGSVDPVEELGPDRYYPMMLYAYPLYERPSDETIKEIHERTNCTVVAEKNPPHEHYLALTGGGMDLSQDVALAYIIAENRVPHELAREVYKSGPLSVGKEDFKKIMEECKKSLESSDRSLNDVKNALEGLEGDDD